MVPFAKAVLKDHEPVETWAIPVDDELSAPVPPFVLGRAEVSAEARFAPLGVVIHVATPVPGTVVDIAVSAFALKVAPFGICTTPEPFAAKARVILESDPVAPIVTVAGFAAAAFVNVMLSTAEVVALDLMNGFPLASLMLVTNGVVSAALVIAVPLDRVAGRSAAARQETLTVWAAF